MISIEYNSDRGPELIEIYLSRCEAKKLAADLLTLAESKGSNRSLGYFNEQWGGDNLTDNPVCEGHASVSGLRVYLSENIE